MIVILYCVGDMINDAMKWVAQWSRTVWTYVGHDENEVIQQNVL